jgi:hypothetical protein
MMELTPLERFQLKCAARRERILRKIRWKRIVQSSVHRELVRRRLTGEMSPSDYTALRDAQRISPGNEVLRKMATSRPDSNSVFAGDDSWD